MSAEAIALRRVSSKGQTEGHSLEAQVTSTEKVAEEMGIRIVRSWDIVQSSKKGKNFGRKDMEEALRYCKQNSRVKYFLIDFVNRLMREAETLIYYKVRFNQLGVDLHFCDPSQQHLNAKDQYSQIMLYLEAYKAEQDNAARIDTTISRMKTRYSDGYYLSHPHAGYVKSDVPGLHVPDPKRFELLQKTGRLIIFDQYTVTQAVRWANDYGYRTVGDKRLDVHHFTEFIVDRYYCGEINIKSDGWPTKVVGLHKKMFSDREHEILVAAVNKRNPNIRYKHNPDFPMGNMLKHHECLDAEKSNKFVGQHYNPGKRPSGKQRTKRPVYDCRNCRKRLRRDGVHSSMTEQLQRMQFLPSDERFKRALVKVWGKQRGTITQRLNVLNANKARIEQKTREMAVAYSGEPEGAVKRAMQLQLKEYDGSLQRISADLLSTRDIAMESEEFLKFAVDFTASIRDKWWDLSWENQKRGELILFNGEIYADNSAKVHTPNLSSIYRLGTNKKALENVSNAFLEELAGTAPASVGLPWLVVYRHSLFCCLSERVLKQTNISFEQS